MDVSQLDRRISDILSRWEGSPLQWEAPLSEEELSAFESEKGLRLPEDYRRFLATVGRAGKGAFALRDPTRLSEYYQPEEPFEWLSAYPPRLTPDTADEEYAALAMNYRLTWGFIPLCADAGGGDCVLVVNSPDEDTEGTVWYYDFDHDFGTAPLLDPETKRPMTFLDWLSYRMARPDGEFTFRALAAPPPEDRGLD